MAWVILEMVNVTRGSPEIALVSLSWQDCFSDSWQFTQCLKVNMDHLFSLI
jgi:hypothetical protein